MARVGHVLIQSFFVLAEEEDARELKAGQDVDLVLLDENGDENSDVLGCRRGQARFEEHGGVLVLISDHAGNPDARDDRL